MSREEAIKTLSFLEKSDILVYEEKNGEILVDEVDLPSMESHTPTIDELYILGYCVLRGIVSFNEISKRLNFPHETVKRHVLMNITNKMITASIGVQSSAFKSSKLFIRVYEHQNFATNSLDNFQEEFQEASMIAGLLILRKESSLSTFLKDITDLNGMKHSKTQLFRILSVLALEPSLQLHLDENDWLSGRLVFEAPSKKGLSPLPQLDLEDFYLSTLLGILAQNHSISLNSIAKQLSIPDKKWKTSEILHLLARLAWKGIIIGFLDDDNVFHLSEINQDKLYSSIVLSKEERILLGMLRAKDPVSLKDLSKVLEISTDAARQVFYQLFSREKMQAEISMAGMIIIKEIPSFPLLSHVQQLPRLQREFYGYILARKRFSLSEIEGIWDVSPLETERLFYDLVGFGIITASIVKEEVVLKQISEVFSQPDPEWLQQDPLLEQAAELLEDHEKPIDMSEISDALKVNENQVIRTLSLLVGHGYYPLGSFQLQVFDKGGKIKGVALKIKCESCKASLEVYFLICPKCGKERQVCIICKGSLEDTGGVASCPHCHLLSHEKHLLAWLKFKEQCPLCRRALDPSQLVLIKK
ncbi:MAG: hypothetical protein ACXAEU_21815 [Candidatus Hodarchaeales archaeon]